jgi:hypothetical protein
VIDYRKELGWWEDEEGVHINPDKYYQQFMASWQRDGAIWDCHRQMTAKELELMRYRFLLKWLKVPTKDPIENAYKSMKSAIDEQAFIAATTACRTAIEVKYCV